MIIDTKTTCYALSSSIVDDAKIHIFLDTQRGMQEKNEIIMKQVLISTCISMNYPNMIICDNSWLFMVIRDKKKKKTNRGHSRRLAFLLKKIGVQGRNSKKRCTFAF